MEELNFWKANLNEINTSSSTSKRKAKVQTDVAKVKDMLVRNLGNPTADSLKFVMCECKDLFVDDGTIVLDGFWRKWWDCDESYFGKWNRK